VKSTSAAVGEDGVVDVETLVSVEDASMGVDCPTGVHAIPRHPNNTAQRFILTPSAAYLDRYGQRSLLQWVF
jgi:hypothetical protein